MARLVLSTANANELMKRALTIFMEELPLRNMSALGIGILFLALSFSPTIVQSSDDVVLHFDASNNPAHPAAWTNLGTAGGELMGHEPDNPPVLEEGAIEIPGAGISIANAKFYSANAQHQVWGGPVGINPEVKIRNWTFEFIVRMNGEGHGEEHQFFAFHSSEPLWRGTFMRIKEGNSLEMSHPPAGVGPAVEDVEEWWRDNIATGIVFEPGVWTWLVFANDDDATTIYQDGVEVHRESPAMPLDEGNAIDDICIGSGMYDERHRNFNGSFSLVRVYNRGLTANEVAGGATAVEPADKLSTAWGLIKTQ